MITQYGIQNIEDLNSGDKLILNVDDKEINVKLVEVENVSLTRKNEDKEDDGIID